MGPQEATFALSTLVSVYSYAHLSVFCKMGPFLGLCGRPSREVQWCLANEYLTWFRPFSYTHTLTHAHTPKPQVRVKKACTLTSLEKQVDKVKSVRG